MDVEAFMRCKWPVLVTPGTNRDGEPHGRVHYKGKFEKSHRALRAWRIFCKYTLLGLKSRQINRGIRAYLGIKNLDIHILEKIQPWNVVREPWNIFSGLDL